MIYYGFIQSLEAVSICPFEIIGRVLLLVTLSWNVVLFQAKVFISFHFFKLIYLLYILITAPPLLSPSTPFYLLSSISPPFLLREEEASHGYPPASAYWVVVGLGASSMEAGQGERGSQTDNRVRERPCACCWGPPPARLLCMCTAGLFVLFCFLLIYLEGFLNDIFLYEWIFCLFLCILCACSFCGGQKGCQVF